MKKNITKISFVLGAAILATAFTACSNKNTGKDQEKVKESVTESSETDKKADKNDSEEVKKIGMGIIVDTSDSKNADNNGDGLAQANSIAAGVTLDSEGKIIDVKIDELQTKVDFDKNGKIITDLKTEFKSKKELKDSYGMKAASNIKKEWDEQIASLEEYAKGKTKEDILAIKLNDKSVPEQPDLNSSVTIKIDKHLEAIEKAIDNARDVDIKPVSKLSLAITSDINDSQDFNDGDSGMVKIYNLYALTCLDKENKISASIIDGTNAELELDDIGQVYTDDDIKTKQELGDDYGMRAASSISKEWNEQATDISEYILGKTKSDIEKIELGDDGKAKDADLLSKATISISPFKSLILKTLE